MKLRAGLILAFVGFLVWGVLVAESVSAAVISASTFDAGTEGWTAIILDNSGNITPGIVSFAAGDGHPGGALRHDAPSDNMTSFFLAPSSVVTALHSATGGSISWDISTIKHSDDVFFSYFNIDINIRAGSNRIRLNVTPPAPPIFPTYIDYSLGFGTGADWLFFDGTTTTTATQGEIDSVLAGATSLIIRAEYWSGSTPDTTFLDNVLIATPQPSSFLLLASALAGLGGHLWAKRRASKRPV